MKQFAFRRFFFRESFAISLTLIVILVSLFFFLRKISYISVPDKQETITSNKVKENVKVYFNTFGIPSIEAQNDNDLFFTIGYVQARDRLWQMDIMRRTAFGRLSELFGKETFELDKFFKALSFRSISKNTLSILNKKTINALSAYSTGINTYIEEHHNKLPFEFQALSYLPEKWKPEDCIAISKLMAFQMSIGFINDVSLAEISEKIGVRKALSLVVDYPKNAPCICDNDFNPPVKLIPPKKEIKDTLKNFQHLDSNITASVYPQILSLLTNIYKTGGSNSFVVKSSKDTNSVLLANDPHLELKIPSYWYECQAISPNFNVTGLMIPGSPFFLIGRNENIAWGITVMMLDDCDFFIERIDPDNEKFYLTPTGKKKFKYRADTLFIKGEQPLYFYTRFTERSAVISDNYIMKNSKNMLNLKDSSNYTFYDKFLLTYSWTGNLATKELEALYELNTASNWKKFKKALEKWYTPGLNWTYADNKGNMGIKPAGFVPKRNKTNPLIPNPGWLDGYAWYGFIKPNELPEIYNPTKEYVASSNNKTSRNFPHYISQYYEPPSRIQRIEEIARIQKYFSVREAEIIQLDNFSYYAKELLFYALPVLNKNKSEFNKLELSALNKLEHWDYIFSPAYSAPTIWNAFYKNLLYLTFQNRMNERLFRAYTYYSQFATMKLLDIIKKNDEYWFDIPKTRVTETRQSVIIKSFKQTVAELKQTFKTNHVNSWKMAHQQKLELNHFLSKNKFIKPAIDGGEYIMSGTYTSINKADWHPWSDYKVSIGASARFITDMADSTILFSILGGNSGDPNSPNYKDQALFFVNGGYIKYYLNPENNVDNTLRIMISPK